MNQTVTVAAQRGVCSQTATYGFLMPNSVFVFGEAGEKFLIVSIFPKKSCYKKVRECIKMSQPLTVRVKVLQCAGTMLYSQRDLG